MDCLIISGLSGAGKSLTVDVLEDIGYYCIDNMPVKLIPQFVNLFDNSAEKDKKVAFVVDIRAGRDHSYLFHALEEMEKAGSRCRILFLECSDQVLINRQRPAAAAIPWMWTAWAWLPPWPRSGNSWSPCAATPLTSSTPPRWRLPI